MDRALGSVRANSLFNHGLFDHFAHADLSATGGRPSQLAALSASIEATQRATFLDQQTKWKDVGVD
ncbi:hypothetical protein AGR1A_pAt20009 [Agrobacterium fabacearum CFBP 5771]|nr:hypothetical protein AGR1A_pAt20009 [Agrobacterium fabacearum CFBP 5771]